MLSWNVAGLNAKMEQPDWGEFIETHEICLFQETWSLNPRHREGIATFCNPAIQGSREDRQEVCVYGLPHIFNVK